MTTRPQRSLSDEMEVFELIANADVAVCYIDAANRHSHYLLGAVRAALVPTIAITKKKDYEFHGNIPREYQPRVVDANEWTTVEETLGTELTICEQDFVELDDQAEVEKYASLLLEVASSTGEYRPATRNIFIEELIMRDQYKVGQGGAIGPGAQAHHIKFQQIWQGGGNNLNLEALASELSRLRTSMKEVAASPEQDSAIGEVAAAEVAARKGDGAGMLSRLAGAGQWALDVATKIGVSVASEALKKAIGQ
ncbi:MAG TPA: hypothetical protein VHR66_09760 [Gemmataceae bacterium]|nr:hypothetical protein [Gemmataceae bacterium]